MKINIHIEDVSLEQIAAISKALRPAQKSNEVVQKSKSRRSWSKKAIKLANKKTPEAPYGFKMDGTPRKPTGPQNKRNK